MSVIWDERPSKANATTYLQRFYDVIQDIVTLETINLNICKIILNRLEIGCDTMTRGHCKKLWAKGIELGLDIDDVCIQHCRMSPVCVQVEANQQTDRLYYNITMLWSKVKDIVDKNEEPTKRDKWELVRIKDRIIDARAEVDTFKSILSDWDK